jgi:hypothetical protein
VDPEALGGARLVSRRLVERAFDEQAVDPVARARGDVVERAREVEDRLERIA